MKIFKISQTENDGYDTFSSAVVIAEDVETARRMHPKNGRLHYHDDSWTEHKNIEVIYLGEAAPDLKNRGVICASFHAG